MPGHAPLLAPAPCHAPSRCPTTHLDSPRWQPTVRGRTAPLGSAARSEVVLVSSGLRCPLRGGYRMRVPRV
jgi:hypothetical protein